MNQQTNNLQHIAVVAGLVVVGFFVYWYGSSAYQFAHEIVPSNQATSTVTISAAKLAELETVARQYRTIAQMVERSATSSFLLQSPERPALSAQVIGRPPQSPYDTLILNIGSREGVKLGAAVWWPPGVYLGEVAEVDKHTSVVELVSAPGVQHSVFIADLPATTVGQGGDGLYAELPDNLSIPVGTAVISDVYELPIGVVAATEQLPTTNLSAVHITRFVSSAVIEHVYVESQ
ncbi:MAG: rod shape-determining protein MreC [Candidatus Paceibacterota bacterium]